MLKFRMDQCIVNALILSRNENGAYGGGGGGEVDSNLLPVVRIFDFYIYI